MRVLALAVLALVACAKPRPLPPPAKSPLASAPLPAFKRPTLAGDALDLETPAGRVIVIDFFAKYCQPCKVALPANEKLHQSMPNVLFVGISEDETEDDARALVREFGLTFPVVHDRDHVLSGRFRVQSLPITFVADRRGVIQWVGDGSHSHEDLEAAIEHVGSTN